MRPPKAHGIIPLDWTPTQAKAVVELLGFLEEAIWTFYEDVIIDKQIEPSDPKYLDELDDHLDDDIPF